MADTTPQDAEPCGEPRFGPSSLTDLNDSEVDIAVDTAVDTEADAWFKLYREQYENLNSPVLRELVTNSRHAMIKDVLSEHPDLSEAHCDAVFSGFDVLCEVTAGLRRSESFKSFAYRKLSHTIDDALCKLMPGSDPGDALETIAFIPVLDKLSKRIKNLRD